ncbi:MAG TPA: AAA family ATPase, partial [Holophaga sp.]|nr:AAA family ATPase [Holophaga sp.]
AMDPALLMLDEPTSALDPLLAREVAGLVKALAGQRRTLLIATHDLTLAREVAGRVVFMEAGRVVEQSPAEAFFAGPRTLQARQFVGSSRTPSP